jgi:WhiB family redox-sensing transcriptional regulator
VVKEWRIAALCQYTDPEIFFVDKGGSVQPALRVCGRCEGWVRQACLADALGVEARVGGKPYGVRGGKTALQREALLKERRSQPVPESPTVARVRRLAAAGMRDHEIARRTGKSPKAINTLRRRKHIPAGQPTGGGRLRDTVRAGVL